MHGLYHNEQVDMLAVKLPTCVCVCLCHSIQHSNMARPFSHSNAEGNREWVFFLLWYKQEH